jgi:hypothetical protein
VYQQVRALCRTAFGDPSPAITALRDVNQGRGAFSIVVRADLAPGPVGVEEPSAFPPSVVAKLPVEGPNGQAAVTSGAYTREAMAYRTVLPESPIRSPELFALDEPGDGTSALLLADLSNERAVDQLQGLTADDALEVATALVRFHHHWAEEGSAGALAGLDVRRNTLARLPHQSLRTGLDLLEQRWGDAVSAAHREVFARLVDRHDTLADQFGRQTPTLCHGDPRADNLFFALDGRPILLDWQQMAVQFGEADLAWLAATSLEVPTRRAVERDLLAAGGSDLDRYRLGLALPGLAVLLLAQREVANDRARRLVACSLHRIATAIADFELDRG